MLKRIVSTPLRLVMGLATLILVLAFAVAARVAIAPLDITWLDDQIEARLMASQPGITVTYDKAAVAWDWRELRPRIEIKSLDLRFREPRMGVNVDVATLRLSKSVFWGDVRIAGIDLGRVLADLPASLFLTERSADVPVNIQDDLAKIAGDLVSLARRGLGGLSGYAAIRVNTIIARLYNNRRQTMLTLVAPRARLERLDDVLRASAELDFQLRDSVAHFVAEIGVDTIRSEVDLSLEGSEIQLDHFATTFNLPPAAGWLRARGNIVLSAALSPDSGLLEANTRIALKNGRLGGEDSFSPDAIVRGGEIRAHFEPERDAVILDPSVLRLRDSDMALSGEFRFPVGQPASFDLSLKSDSLPARDISTYWPITRYADGRRRGAGGWVFHHILDGELTNLAVTLSSGEGTDPELLMPGSGLALDLTFGFRDLDLYFLTTMPPVHAASGEARMRGDDLTLQIDGGMLGQLPVLASSASLTTLGDPDVAKGEFDIRVQEDVTEILAALDHYPLQLGSRIGIAPSRLGGAADVDAQISLALKAPPGESRNLDYAVTAKLSDFSLRELLAGPGLSAAALDLVVTPAGAKASGRGLVNAVPLQIDWSQDFAASEAGQPASRVTARGEARVEDLERLLIPASQYAAGPVSFEFLLEGEGDKFSGGRYRADVSDAVLWVADLGWGKSAGIPASIEGSLRLEPDGGHLPDMRLTGPSLDAELDLRWQDDGSVEAYLDARQLGRNVLTASFVQAPESPFSISITASSIDLSPFLGSASAAEKDYAALRPSSPVSAVGGDLDVALTARRAHLLNGVDLKDLTLSADFEDGGITLALGGAVFWEGGEDLGLVIEPGQDGGKSSLLFKSADGGKLLRGLGYFAQLEGGDLVLEGEISGWGDSLSMDASFDGAGATLYKSERFAGKADFGLLPALDKYINDGGDLLKNLETDLSVRGSLVDLSNFRGNGNSVGLTMEGQLDRAARRVNLNGVFVPAYGINTLLGRIPIVGTVFSGGEGRGLIGINYRIKGDTDNPEVRINPLSSLAPGFLGRLTGGSKGKVEDVEIPSEPGETADRPTAAEPPDPVM